MSDATIVSVLPFDYSPQFPGLVGRYFVPKAEEGDFVVVHVPDGTGLINMTEGRPSIRQTYTGEQIAGSIANDLINASMYKTDVAWPGIKAIPGIHTKEDIKKKFPDLLDGINKAQTLWFGEWVKAADDIWSDPNARGKAQSISDMHRISATRLGLNREWAVAQRTDQVRCPACTNYMPGAAFICPHCKTIVNQEAYDKKFKKAG